MTYKSPALPDAQLSHVGLYVRDLDTMVEFYCRVMGMIISDRALFNGRTLAFLTRNAAEHHQLVLIQDPARNDEAESSVNQLSFRLSSLEDLRQYHSFLFESKAAGLEGRNHGNSWSLYFFDPEGNKIELYVPTDWAVSQPWRAPLDLTNSLAAIVDETNRMMRQEASSRPVQQWETETLARLGQ